MWAGMDDGLGLRVGGGQIAWPTLLGTDERRHDFELDLKKKGTTAGAFRERAKGSVCFVVSFCKQARQGCVTSNICSKVRYCATA